MYISPARLDRVAGRAGIGKRSGFCRRTSRTVTVIAASTRSGLRNEIDFKRLMGSTGDRGDSRRSSFSLQSCLSPILPPDFPGRWALSTTTHALRDHLLHRFDTSSTWSFCSKVAGRSRSSTTGLLESSRRDGDDVRVNDAHIPSMLAGWNRNAHLIFQDVRHDLEMLSERVYCIFL